MYIFACEFVQVMVILIFWWLGDKEFIFSNLLFTKTTLSSETLYALSLVNYSGDDEANFSANFLKIHRLIFIWNLLRLKKTFLVFLGKFTNNIFPLVHTLMYDLSFVQNHVSDKHQYLKRRINPKKNSPKTPEVVFRTQETELSQDPLTSFDLFWPQWPRKV